MLSPFNLPQGIFLLITDELSAPADFLLHRVLHQHLKASRASHKKATILLISEGLARWKSVASRSNLNLDNHLSSNSLQFIDVLSHVQIPQTSADKVSASVSAVRPALKPVFDLVLDSLASITTTTTTTSGSSSDSEKTSSGAGAVEPGSLGICSELVILDDISTLEWIGFSLLDIVRFVRALRAACIKANATFVIRHHRVSDEPDELFSHLYHLCAYHLEVRGLASGRSGSVSGEIALHAGPATIPKDVNLLPRSCAMQYRLTDASAVFFEKGTGGAVL
ncbi:hypothetical protein AX15_003331 [Amanita polypyramis BW_CC]|nr:hypothetical protein AX15_003331 [Amanita polypyramis BW_CC]